MKCLQGKITDTKPQNVVKQFKKDLSSSEDLIELQKKVKEIELEQTKLRILPSSQKNIDSLHNPNSYKIK